MRGLFAILVAAVFAVPVLAQETKDAAPPSVTQPAETKTVPDQTEFKYVKMTTSKGDIFLALNNTKAPISTANFLSYTEKKHYDGTIFHRVIDSFMIQGGGFTPDMTQKPTDAAIKNEWQNGLKNKRGTIAMARTSTADSATAQFFINVVDNAALDMARPQTGNAAYAVFGEVIAGMDVVDAIRKVKTGQAKGMGDVPVEPVIITSVKAITEAEAKAASAVPSVPAKE